MVHFIGAGPGAADLITLRGARLLKEADVVIYAGSLVDPQILSFCREGCELYNSARMTLEEILEIISQAEASGKNTVRLHSGDPSLYGAVREQMSALESLGIPYDDTPGVSSFCAAAARLKTEYTIPGISQTVILTRMEGRTMVPETEKLSDLARHKTSLVIFLSAGLAGQVQASLLEGGRDPEEAAVLAYRVSWPDEKIVHCTVGTLASSAAENDISKTALILVGSFLDSVTGRSRLYSPDFSTEYRQTSASDSARPEVDLHSAASGDGARPEWDLHSAASGDGARPEVDLHSAAGEDGARPEVDDLHSAVSEGGARPEVNLHSAASEDGANTSVQSADQRDL